MPGWPARAYHPGVSSDTPQKAAIFGLDALRAHGVGEVLLRLRIRPQGIAVRLIRGQADELDHCEGKVVRSFLRQKVSEQRAAAPTDDWRPGCGVTFKVRDSMRIKRVAYAASDHASTLYCTRSRRFSRGTPSPRISDLK